MAKGRGNKERQQGRGNAGGNRGRQQGKATVQQGEAVKGGDKGRPKGEATELGNRGTEQGKATRGGGRGRAGTFPPPGLCSSWVLTLAKPKIVGLGAGREAEAPIIEACHFWHSPAYWGLR